MSIPTPTQMAILMKLSCQTFVCIALCSLLLFAADTNAQDSKEKTQKTQTQKTTTKKNQKGKANKVKRPTFVKSLNANVSDLTDEQKAGVKALQEKASAKHKEINESVGLTWAMNKKREEILEAMSDEGTWKERNGKASRQAGFNDDQIKSLKKVGEAYRTFRYEAMKLLTAEQQAKMPKWHQDDYKKSVKMAQAKAKEEKSGKKETRTNDK